jgi:hypothetical protein
MKVWNYMMIMLTMMIFLSFIGLPLNQTDDSSILSSVGININSTTGKLVSGDVASSSWYDNLFNPTTGLIVLAGIGTAIIVGFFTKQFDWKLVLVGFFTSFAIQFVSVGWQVVQLAKNTGEDWLVAIIATIFLPLTAMFIFSIVEWFGGAD